MNNYRVYVNALVHAASPDEAAQRVIDGIATEIILTIEHLKTRAKHAYINGTLQEAAPSRRVRDAAQHIISRVDASWTLKNKRPIVFVKGDEELYIQDEFTSFERRQIMDIVSRVVPVE